MRVCEDSCAVPELKAEAQPLTPTTVAANSLPIPPRLVSQQAQGLLCAPHLGNVCARAPRWMHPSSPLSGELDGSFGRVSCLCLEPKAMRPDLFWAAWGPLSVWRRRHACIVRRNRVVEEKVRAEALRALCDAFAVWRDDEAVQLRRELVLFAPVFPPFAEPPLLGAFWILYGGGWLLALAGPAEGPPVAPWSELVPNALMAWPASWEVGPVLHALEDDEDGE